jgi:hypothetical protein
MRVACPRGIPRFLAKLALVPELPLRRGVGYAANLTREQETASALRAFYLGQGRRGGLCRRIHANPLGNPQPWPTAK